MQTGGLVIRTERPHFDGDPASSQKSPPNQK